MANVYKPPVCLASVWTRERFKVFLAGSIEMGKAEDWQATLEDMLRDRDWDLYNPRRDDWDPTWEQKADNPPFREQVEWELNALEQANSIVMYLSPGTISPISLLELGLHAHGEKLIVCCPEGFHRKGNVDILCQRYHITQVESLGQVVPALERQEQKLNRFIF